MERHILVLVCTALLTCSAWADDIQSHEQQTAGSAADTRLRFWWDDYAFGEGETAFFKEAVAEHPNATTAGVTRGRFLTIKGYQQASKWDVYWTSRAACFAAFRLKLLPSHLVNCLPGSEAMTEKAWLFWTLRAAYGRLAAAIAPEAFQLPREYFQLARTLVQEAPASWVLKTGGHQGKGVHVVPSQELLARAVEREGTKPKFSMAQRLVSNQLLVNSRPFYIRVWALMFGTDPVRAYLFDGGVVVFGTPRQPGEGTAAGSDLVVNLWRQDRKAADPWSLQQLHEHLAAAAGQQAADRVWQQMQLSVAATVAAALPHMRREAAKLPKYRGHSSGFAVYGADFVLDASLKPWLIEMNALPSLARKVIRGGAGAPANPFDEQKQRFVAATLQVLLARHGAFQQQQQQQQQGAGAAGGQASDTTALALEAALREAAAAQAHDFAVLTPTVYQALDCLAAGRNVSCAVLHQLDQGSLVLEQQQQQQECRPSEAGAVQWGQGWRVLLGHVVRYMPRFNWGSLKRQVHAKAAAPLIRLSALDRTMLR